MNRVIVTGASEGLGFELSKLFLEKDISVTGISRTRPNLKVDFIKTDLTVEEDIENAASMILKDYSDFDAIINCAGVLNVTKANELEYNKVAQLFKLNVIAPMILVSKLFDKIKANEADIVNVGSTLGFKAYQEQAAYGSSK
ncbi:MAG: SDR family oxidoreductase [Candidatus Dojkabacteria bacterium]|nr:SDR family oxidoreductase [Candidatus Dojkabacteria bacterium]